MNEFICQEFHFSLCAKFLIFSLMWEENCTKVSQVNFQLFLTHTPIFICPPSSEASTVVNIL